MNGLIGKCYSLQQIVIIGMKKDLMLGNKIIYHKIHKRQRQRHLSKLQEIKNRPACFNSYQPSFFRQSTSTSDQKLIELQRNNIVLFNRIASIIKQRPKMTFPKSRNFVKSLDNALFKQEKKQQQLKIKHELYSRRISEQQPTIKNDLIFKDRIKHERYLKNIARYPHNSRFKTQSEFELSQQQDEDDQQIFHQRTLDFDIRINKNTTNNEYIFTVFNVMDQKEFKLVMVAQKFKQELEQCQLNYERMVGNLRMDKNGEMKYNQSEIKSIVQSHVK